MSEINVDFVKFAGILFGDGYITKRGNLCFKHSIVQKEYALFKAHKCYEYFGLKHNKYLQKKQENSFSVNDNFLISCHSKTWTKKLREDWYFDSTKKIPIDIVSKFGIEEWSFIYQDDGRQNKISHTNNLIDGKRVRRECIPFVNRYEICLGRPDDDTISALLVSLNRINVEASILTRKDGQKNISISKSSSKISFYESIYPFMFDSLKYKFSCIPTLSYSK